MADQVSANRIFQSDNLECIFKDRGGDTLLITFNEMGMRANGEQIWADGPAQKMGLSVAGFVTTRPNWFPPDDMRACISILESALLGRNFRRITFGLSQGAYAALKYSRLLGSDTNIAFSPQVSISPEDVKDTRFSRFYNDSLHQEMAIVADDLGGDSFVFFDPYDASDSEHCEILSRIAPINLVRLPFVGHSSIRAFAGTENLKAVLQACSNRDVAALRRQYNRAKNRNPHRPYLMAMELISRHPLLALKVFEKYRLKSPTSPWTEACFRLSAAGYSKNVIGWVRQNATHKFDDHAAQACAALVSLKTDDPFSALSFIDRALEILPHHKPYEHTRERARAMIARKSSQGEGR